MMEKLYMKRLQHTIALTLSIAGGLYHMAWAAPPDATALPTGEDKLENATVTRDTTTNPTKPVMTIEQTKGQNRAFISWDTFNIGKDATVNIKQYSGADLLVNAVRGSDMSEIAGKLNATGNVALINPNGVIFMNGAQVNVGGLGVYATSYSVDDKANVSILNSGKEGSIEIQGGATINAGVKAVLANLSALNMDPKDYAIAIDSTGESGYTNRIHLVAEGNVDIQGGTAANPTKVTAKDYTYIGTKASVGEEGFQTKVSGADMGGKIYIRSDRDADDYGSVIITHGENASKPVMQSVNGVSIYTNAEQADGDAAKPGINAAVSRTESGDGATTTYYTKHDYKNGPSYEIDGSSYTDGTSVSVEGPGVTADKLSSSSADNKIATSYAGNGATTITTSLLVNNIDQLQDIEDGTYGNLDGRYVLGRDINATDDVHSYIDDGVLYKIVDGNLVKWSTADGVEITGTKSGGNLSKTVDGTTIGYSRMIKRPPHWRAALRSPTATAQWGPRMRSGVRPRACRRSPTRRRARAVLISSSRIRRVSSIKTDGLPTRRQRPSQTRRIPIPPTSTGIPLPMQVITVSPTPIPRPSLSRQIPRIRDILPRLPMVRTLPQAHLAPLPSRISPIK